MSDEMPAWDTSKQAIGQRLSAVRRARGYTGLALAEAIEVSPQRLNNYESGKTTIPPDILARVARVTGVTSDYVLFGRLDSLPYDLAIALQDGRRAGRPA